MQMPTLEPPASKSQPGATSEIGVQPTRLSQESIWS